MCCKRFRSAGGQPYYAASLPPDRPGEVRRGYVVSDQWVTRSLMNRPLSAGASSREPPCCQGLILNRALQNNSGARINNHQLPVTVELITAN
jgi:hypothetical protein